MAARNGAQLTPGATVRPEAAARITSGHHVGVIGGHGAGHEVAERVPEHDRGSTAVRGDDAGDVIGEVVECDPGHRSGRSRDAARLGPQDPVLRSILGVGDQGSTCVTSTIPTVGPKVGL